MLFQFLVLLLTIKNYTCFYLPYSINISFHLPYLQSDSPFGAQLALLPPLHKADSAPANFPSTSSCPPLSKWDSAPAHFNRDSSFSRSISAPAAATVIPSNMKDMQSLPFMRKGNSDSICVSAVSKSKVPMAVPLARASSGGDNEHYSPKNSPEPIAKVSCRPVLLHARALHTAKK